jgi:phenylacetate-CoA ligase
VAWRLQGVPAVHNNLAGPPAQRSRRFDALVGIDHEPANDKGAPASAIDTPQDVYGRLLGSVLLPAWERLRRRPTYDLLDYVERMQWASADELHALQCGLLRRLGRHAYHHTAHYRRAFDAAGLGPLDLRSPADLARLPLLERADARASTESRVSDGPPAVTVRKSTGGSTGEPMLVAYGSESRHWRDAIRWRGYGWAGYRPGHRALHFWGYGAQVPANRWQQAKLDLDRRLRRDRYVDCTPRGEECLERAVSEIRTFRPDVIVAYSQAVAALARHVLRTGARTWGTIPVLCGAERLWAQDRRDLEAAFGPAVYETYGCREFMLIGSECAHHDGLHVSMENLVVELVVRLPDGRHRAARPGEVGEVVVTDLHNLASPFLRYVTGDLATALPPGRCPCGRTLERLGAVEGRVSETLRDGDGNPVDGILFSILVTRLAPHVLQFQAIQRTDGSVTLRIVPVGGAVAAEVHELASSFARRYLPGVDFRVEPVRDIPTTAAGKRRIVIVESASPRAAAAAH